MNFRIWQLSRYAQSMESDTQQDERLTKPQHDKLTRAEIIGAKRLNQPQSELDNKAAERKGKLWTQEELDAADKYAQELAEFFARDKNDRKFTTS